MILLLFQDKSKGAKMKYFKGCKTIEEAKRRKRDLMMDYHPDRMNVITQQIAGEWDELTKSAAPDGTLPEIYHPSGEPQIIDRIVYRDRVQRVEVPVERIVYRDPASTRWSEIKTSADRSELNDRICDYSANYFA